MKRAKPCKECCGGRPLPVEPPWDRFLEGECIFCRGLGYLDCVPLSSVRVGSVFAYANGTEFQLANRHPDGTMGVLEQKPGAQIENEPRKRVAVRVVRAAEVFLEVQP